MRLIYAKDITTDDLAYIETAYFAIHKVKSGLLNPFQPIQNLEWMLRAVDDQPNNMWGQEERQWKRLLKMIERYEVVLLMGMSIPTPLKPVFRWKVDETHPKGGLWENATPNAMGAIHLDWLLSRTPPSHHSLVQAARAAAAAVPGKSASEALQVSTHDVLLDVRHEQARSLNGHLPIKDGTRYTLTTDRKQVREGVVQNGRVEEKDLEMSSGYTLVFVKPT